MNDVNEYGLLDGLSDEDKADVMAEVDSLTRIVELERELAEYRKSHLLELMRDMSETAYCAGWLIGLEFYLWKLVTGTWEHSTFGMYDVPSFANEIADLKRLSTAVNGWWVWDDGEKFISMDEWLPMFEKGPTR